MILTTIGDEIGNTLKEQIEVLKKANINYVEVRKINDKYLYDFSENEIKKIKHELDCNNISVITVDTPIGKKKNAFNYEENLKLLLQYLKIAQVFNAKYLRIFSDVGKVNNECSIEEVLKEFSNLASEKSIEIIIENEKETFAQSTNVCGKLIRNLNNINILFDVENSSNKNFNILGEYQNNKKKIKYIHLRDYDSNKQMYTYIGEGTLPLAELFKELKNDNYNGVISLETMLPKYNKQDSKEKIFIESYSKFIRKYQEV